MPLTQEIQTAVSAVRRAAKVCRAVQQRLATADALTKKDKSPVTVADFASQAVVCEALARAFPCDAIVGEEGTGELRLPEQAALRGLVVEEAGKVFDQPVDEASVLEWIDRGAVGHGKEERFWTLDPIDGTKGFLRREQYAVALALIENGRVVLGVLGCPNLALCGTTGALVVAVRGGGTQLLPMWEENSAGRPVRVSHERSAKAARFCESVESGHSDQGASAKIAAVLGITAPPLRMDSQAKYATLAGGEASIYLRLPTRGDYREKIWDHAAGVIAVEEAGGRVTDTDGRPLEFTHGRELTANRGIVATNGPFHADVVEAVRAGMQGISRG